MGATDLTERAALQPPNIAFTTLPYLFACPLTSFLTFSLALIDGSFTVFRMLYLLPRPESTPSFWFFGRKPGHAEFLPARSKEFCDVVDRVVGLARIRWSLATPVIAPRPAHTLIFIFISIVP